MRERDDEILQKEQARHMMLAPLRGQQLKNYVTGIRNQLNAELASLNALTLLRRQELAGNSQLQDLGNSQHDLLMEKTARLEAKKQAEAAQASSSRSRGGTASTATLPAHERCGVTFNAFYKSIHGKMIVKSPEHLRDLLKEFIDHGVIAYHVPQGASEQYVYFKFPYDSHLQNNLVQKVMSVIRK